MKCLVLEGLGFIGSHLVEHLVEGGDRVTIVDSGARPANWKPPKRVEVLKGDARHFLHTHMKERFNEVYHLASVVGPVSLLREPGLIARMLVDDLYAVIDYCTDTPTKMLYVSTSEVYGGSRLSAEDDDCVIHQREASARMEYTVGKLLDEVVIRNTPNLHAVIVRPFNVSGARQGVDGGFVIPRLVRQALKGEPLTVYEDGSCVRSFTHVKDVVRGMALALRQGENKRVFNLGNVRNRTTIFKLAIMIRNLAKSESEIKLVDPKTLWGPLFREAGDKVPNAFRAGDELDWVPGIGLEEIIADVIEEVRGERERVSH